jgi:hypothetical protein
MERITRWIQLQFAYKSCSVAEKSDHDVEDWYESFEPHPNNFMTFLARRFRNSGYSPHVDGKFTE